MESVPPCLTQFTDAGFAIWLEEPVVGAGCGVAAEAQPVNIATVQKTNVHLIACDIV